MFTDEAIFCTGWFSIPKESMCGMVLSATASQDRYLNSFYLYLSSSFKIPKTFLKIDFGSNTKMHLLIFAIKFMNYWSICFLNGIPSTILILISSILLGLLMYTVFFKCLELKIRRSWRPFDGYPTPNFFVGGLGVLDPLNGLRDLLILGNQIFSYGPI